MSAGPVILAADAGTSSLKLVAFDRHGMPVDQAAVDYPTHAPCPGAREQESGDWWAALVGAVGALAPGYSVEALVLTGTMQNCIAIGARGGPLGRAILYSDGGVSAHSRAACEARLPDDFARRVGNVADGAMPLFRLMGGDPRLRRGADVRYHFGAKDVLLERLTGRSVTDPTTATTSGLFGLAAGAWDAELVDAAELALDQLPQVLAADALVGSLLAEAAAALGMPAGVPVINGAGDAGAATWGAGGGSAGRAHAYLGTTGWIASTMTLAQAAPPRDTYTLAAPVGSDVIAIAPLLQAGSVLDWLRGLGSTASASDLAAVDRAPPSALFLPYLAGERSPFRDRDVRAGFLGLDAHTGPRELRYAALEGLCHAIRDNLESLGLRPADMPLIGGVAEDPVLRQLLADVLDMPVAVASHPRLATAYGAFLFGTVALGWPAPLLRTEPPTKPRAERRTRAERRFSAYRRTQGAARAVAADLLLTPDPKAGVTKEDHA